jgi:hydrophobe/amphiphile efflux-1 (HAE1) family protein
MKAMREVFGPILATTLVLLGLFVPVAFVPGLTGSLYNQFALTIAVTVALSSLTALTLTPALARVMLRRRDKPPPRPFRAFNRGFERATAGYGGVVRRLLRVWWAVLVGFVVLIAVVLLLFVNRPTGFVPAEDQGYLILDVQLPPGAALQRTAAVVRELEARLLAQPEVEEVVAIAGSSLIGSASSYAGFLIPRLAPWGERETVAADLVSRLQREFGAYPHARVQVINPPSLPGIGAGGGLSFEVQALENQSVDELAAVGGRLIGALNGLPEIAAAFTTFNADVPQLDLDVDIDKAEQLGLPADVLYGALQTYLGSAFVNEFNRFGRVYRVYVQAEARARDEPADIGRLMVRNLEGAMVPLDEVVDVRFATGPEAIQHFNLYRSVGVIGQPAPGVSDGEAVAAVERLLRQNLPPGYGYGWTGAVYQQNKAGNITPLIFALAVLFAFLTLSAQYENLLLPIVILLAAPLAMLGALGLLTVLNMPIDVFAQIGLLMLVGLSAKNAILIVAFAEDARHAGADPFAAARTAGTLRLRPILMTALSFILGASPLAFASGAGANAQASVGLTVIGGMTAATLLTLLVTPVLYMLVARLRGRLAAERQPA